MITVKIEEYEALNMLMDRLEQWTSDDDVIKLYELMYENYVDCGVFEGCEFNVMAIVDNDYVNYCEVLSEGDDEYEAIKEIYEAQGLGDCSCEHKYYSYIESEYNGMFLVRC